MEDLKLLRLVVPGEDTPIDIALHEHKLKKRRTATPT
jgi:hypothetical protein